MQYNHNHAKAIIIIICIINLYLIFDGSHHETVQLGLILNFRFGRKKVIVASLILAAVSSIGAVLFTTKDNSNKGLFAS